MNYLDRNLTKYVQDLYAENYKTLVRETIEEICPQTGRLNSVKMSSSLQIELQIQCNPIKSLAGFGESVGGRNWHTVSKIYITKLLEQLKPFWKGTM